jgi:RNA polymerase sigma factor (sigma-70 family)
MAGRLAPPQSDRELLARFVGGRDEAAFAALVHRHGPTVYGVCRRVLGNPADADDAFQAVFLVLVNRADALAHRPALGGWLHEVAVRVAMKARTALARLRRHERRAAAARAEPVFDPPPHDPPAWLDREVAALPERLREPVVRCLIQDRPRSEVAAELGIPEGTLASRLDAARKRLAGRLARHRVPLALGGLSVPVPPALAAATVGRATDGAGAVVRQLANEVTQMMVSKTKWVALAAVVVPTAAVGGLLLAAAVAATPVARQDPPVPMPPVPVRNGAKEPPEPAWAAAFRKAYALKDGEYVKRVAPPYIGERKEYLYRVSYPAKQTPEEERITRDRLDREQLFLSLFLDFDDGKLTRRTVLSFIRLADVPKLQNGERIMNVWDAVTHVTGREPPEVLIDPKSADHPLLSTKEQLFPMEGVSVRGVLSVGGDFVTRKDAPLEKLVPQLEKILREECRLDVRLTLREEEQPVFVVGGTFKPNPPAWRPKKELDVYATEAMLNKEYDHFDPNNNPKTEKYETVRSNQYGGAPIDFVRFVGSRLGTRMVWDAPLPTEPKLSWIDHTIRNPSPEAEAADRDPDRVLKVVAEQTGLTFKKEHRKVAVLYLGTSEKR